MNSKVALVIGSGSVKCAAALGLQRVLTREGIDIDLVVGCSGGALYATQIALGIDADTAIEMTRRMWTREITARTNRRSLLSMMLPRVFGFTEEFGLRDDRLVMQRLNEAFGDKSFDQTKIPLFIAATDFRSGDQVVLSSGNLVDALRASIAMPFVFKPWRVGDRLLTDGYLSDPLPIGVAIKEGAQVIVAIGFESPQQTHVNSAMRFAFQVSSIMTNNLLKSNYAFHSLAHYSEVVAIVPEFRERIRLFDTDKIEMIIEAGERATQEQIPYLKKVLAAEQ
jgi:NTE family protein